jgi:cytochrome c-type biogenesis protein CcmF
MSTLGSFSLFLAFGVSAYAVIASLLGVKIKSGKWIKSGQNAVFAVTGLLTLAAIVLIYAFVIHNFQIQYVAEHSSKNLPIFYRMSALWGGQEGSLLLWGWLLGVFASLVLLQNRRRNQELIPYVLAVMMGVSFFFLGLLVFATRPFLELPFFPSDGRGLNPLLQNPGMILHPPTLYIGYVGFSVPFAFAIAALLTRRLGDTWIKSSRRWALFSWLFLTLGNLFGAQWAYVELGWGGYWAWDPVENASLIPWLTGTAYLHSVMIQERRGMLKVWNMVLIILTFALTLFGTFLVRSGILSSVHSFAVSPLLGALFLTFTGAILLFSFILLVNRLDLLRSENELDSFLSRESTFLFNNLILVGAAFAIFWGTIFPLISEAVRGVKITVGPPFYNQIMVPIGLALLLLTGICPLISWRRASGKNLKKNFLYPFIIAIIGGIMVFRWTIQHPSALISFTLSIFVAATIVIEFFRGSKVRREMRREGHLKSFFNLISRNKRRYGGYLIHMGVVLIFVGITGSSAFKSEKLVTLKKGESLTIKDYELKYENFSSYPTESKYVTAATLSVYRKGKKLGTLRPERNLYRGQQQSTTEVAIRSTLVEDLYVILAQHDQDGRATFKVLINPLIMWIWIGGFVLAGGTMVVMWPDKKERQQLAFSYVRER